MELRKYGLVTAEPSVEMSGQIIAFLGEEYLASQLNTVVINLGLADNLQVGNILSITNEGSNLTDDIAQVKIPFRERMRSLFDQDSFSIPGNDIGTLLVYKTFDHLSCAVILARTEPAELYDEAVSP